MTIRRGIIALGVMAFLAIAAIASFGGGKVANACCSGDPLAPGENEMHIAAAGLPVAPVGGSITFNISIGTAQTAYAGYQWETGVQLAVAHHTGYTDSPPAGMTSCSVPLASVPIPGDEVFSPGGCLNSSGGTSTSTQVVATVTIMCDHPGQAAIELIGLDQDPLFGSTTLAPGGANIPTELNPQLPNPAPPPATVAAAGFACVAPVDVGIAKSGPATGKIGDTGTYTLHVTNADPANPQQVNVTDNDPGTGATLTSVDNGPACALAGGNVTCTHLSVPAAGSVDVHVGVTFDNCGTVTNTATVALFDPAPPSRVDPNPANNTSSASTSVSCPTATKAAPSSANTNSPITYTITASGYSTTNPVTVTVTDTLPAGMTFGSGAGCVAGVTCTGATVAGTVTFTFTATTPATSGQVCNTATANPGNAATNSACTTVLAPLNGIAKDTGFGNFPSSAQFSLGNLWLCKDSNNNIYGNPQGGLPPMVNGAGQPSCGTFVIREAAQASNDLDTCNDDNDHDGKPCAGDPSQPPAPWQSPSDGCLDVATDYIPGVTAVDCNGGETPEGLGAFEFQVKYDDKIFNQPTFDCSNGVLGSTGRTIQAQVSVITENWVQFGCVTKDFGAGIAGPSIAAGAATLGTLTLTVENDMYSRLRPAKDNGVVTNLLDENCELADTLGQPYNLALGQFGANTAPAGGHTQDCKDAALTVRMLEGDVNLDCQVTTVDDQMEAFRYGQFFGELAYNRFFDLEPQIAPDFDIDIKDLQTVFGRNGSFCTHPIPTQNPNPTTPDP